MRSHYCGQVNESLIGKDVSVAGWVHRRRDHGGVIFVDLRDREGLLQIVFDPDAKEVFANAERLRGAGVAELPVQPTLRALDHSFFFQQIEDSQPRQSARECRDAQERSTGRRCCVNRRRRRAPCGR